ncbi:MAG: LysM peptidoglycan-binding domain-containing protein [Gemmatimonadota bacterium]
MERRYTQAIIIGAVLLLVSLSAAWSAARPGMPVDAAPMERIVGTAADEASSVVWDLPVTRNESVDVWISFLKGRNRDHTQAWLEREGRYGPMIRGELRRRGMPEDLVYLAMIESGLSPRAYSRAAASGLWQFIEETGERYGLEVTPEVDERRDPVEATGAALEYLQELYERFGSWYLAAAAYNTGENRVGRIMRETYGTERGVDDHFWKIAHRLPRETRDYVPLMLAAGHIAKQPAEYGFDDIEYEAPLAYDVVWVPGATELSLIAKASGVSADSVAALNTHLIRGRTPSGRAWSVRIPKGTRVAFDAAFPELFRSARLEATTPTALASATHRVGRGETLSHIARRYGVSVSALRSANGALDPRRIRVGQAIMVPGGTAAAQAEAAYHRVNRGENLTVIARRYGISLSQIRSWNGLNGSRIQPGQRLRVSS